MYLVKISKNEEGHVQFDDLITKICNTEDEAIQFVLDTINGMLDTEFTDIDELSNHLFDLDDYGYAPLYDIEHIELPKQEHYAVINEYAVENSCDISSSIDIIGVTHTKEEAKEIFNKKVKEEKEFALSEGYEIYEDDEDVFDAGKEGEYALNHTKIFIQKG